MDSTGKASYLSAMPFQRGEYRYEEEGPELNYRPGGFHPVLVGDIYNKYKIIRKLGSGSFSTVWLAENCM
jgi:serine/threonine protein kinase